MPEIELVLFDWADVGGVQQVIYLGKAPFGAGQGDPKWQIKKFSYTQEGDTKFYVTQIQTLDGKIWTDRATLPWS